MKAKEVARAAAAHGADAERLAQSERVEFVGGVDLVVIIDLVADRDHRLGGAAQQVGQHLVEVGDAGRDSVSYTHLDVYKRQIQIYDIKL